MTHFQGKFDVQWQDRIHNIYSPLNVHPCIFPPGYPSVPPRLLAIATTQSSFSTLDTLNNHLGSPQHLAAFQAFLPIEIIRRLATNGFTLADNRMYATFMIFNTATPTA